MAALWQKILHRLVCANEKHALVLCWGGNAFPSFITFQETEDVKEMSIEATYSDESSTAWRHKLVSQMEKVTRS